MARPEGETSNALLDTLADWNEILKNTSLGACTGGPPPSANDGTAQKVPAPSRRRRQA
jgi:hypothetical protein